MSRYLAEATRLLEPYVPGEQPRGGVLAKLNTNENPYPVPRSVKNAIAEAAEGLYRYCDAEAAVLTRTLANFHNVKPEQILTANGSDEMLAFAYLAFFRGRKLDMPDISYGFYPVYAQTFGAFARQVPLREDFTLCPEDYDDPEANVVFANPNAPTGIPLLLSGVRQLLEDHPDRVVLADEAYVDFGGESALPLLEEYDNLLICRTFSKYRGLAGARLGYAIGSPALIADLNRVKFGFNPYNVNSATQAAGVAAVGEDVYYRDCAEKIILERERVRCELERRGFRVLPSGTNFLFASPPDRDGAGYAARLRRKGVLVRHFARLRIEGFVRITIGTPEQMNLLLEATE